MRIVRAVYRLTRLDTSLLVFLSLFVPSIVRTRELALSLGRAAPLLFIAMCTFVANDLDDLEKDKVNHPNRPLPAQHLSSAEAAVIYFICLALALLLTRHFAESGTAFWYYALMIFSISYGYVVENLPNLKAPYVAAAISIPVLIVAALYPQDTRLHYVVGSVFLVALGRELCMDLEDRAGDPASAIQKIRPERIVTVAFVLQLAGLCMVIPKVSNAKDLCVLMTLVLLLALATASWFMFKLHKRAIDLMKLQFLAGLYFLT